MFKTAPEVVELFCACVQTLKEFVMFGMTKPLLPSWGIYHAPALTVQAPRFTLWLELLPKVLQNPLRIPVCHFCFWHCCNCHLTSGLCLPCFICPVLPFPPCVSLPCHRQVLSLHVYWTPEFGRMCSECADMAGTVYQTGRIRNAIPRCLPKPSFFSDGFPGVWSQVS